MPSECRPDGSVFDPEKCHATLMARGAYVARCEDRRETNWIALIRLPDGSEIPTTVRDISPSGARLAVPCAYALPERFLFKVVGRDFVCAVRLAWRRDDAIGVRIERVGKVAAGIPK